MDPAMAGFFMGGPGGDGPTPQRKTKTQGRFAVLREIYDDPFRWFVVYKTSQLILDNKLSLQGNRQKCPDVWRRHLFGSAAEGV